jgi:tetratricopeptide (TPR) repeat protein
MASGLRGPGVYCLAAATLLALPMMRAPAAAQGVDCNGIDDCTALIRSGKYAGKDLARLFRDRCSKYIHVDYNRAIADCNEAIRLDSLSSAIDDRGLAYLEKADYDHAIADLSEAIRLADEGYRGDVGYRILYFIGRARAYRAKGDYDHATADLDGAILLASSEQLSAGLLSLRGDVYSMKGDNNRAIADYNASLKARPNVASALYGRGLAKLKNGDVTGGNADIAAVKAIRADIADEEARSKRNFWKETN